MASTDTVTVYRGEDVDLNFTMVPVTNITGWTLLFTVEKGRRKVITKTPVIVSAAAGTYKVSLTQTDTNIKEGTYQYDVWRIDDGSERVLSVGSLVISDDARFPEAAS